MKMHSQTFINGSFSKKILISTIFLLLFSLFLYIKVGFSTLMMADDYCYFSLLKNQSFFSALAETYTSAIVIAGNRFSATLFSLLASLIGPYYIQFSPLFSIIGLLVSFNFLVFQAIYLFFNYSDRLLSIFISATLLNIMLYIAPSSFQNIYWFSGVVAYTTPIIIYSFFLGFYFLMLRYGKNKLWQFLVLFALSFISSGFSETSAVSFMVHFLLFSFIIFFNRKKSLLNLKFIIPILSIGLGILLLIISPSANRRNSGSENINFDKLFDILVYSFRYGFDFLLDQIKSYSLPILILIIAMFAISGFINTEKVQLSLRRIIILIFFTFFATLITISASMSPQIFAFNAYPNVRSQFIPLFFLLNGISILSLLFGLYLIRRYQKITLLLLLPIFLSGFYYIRAGYFELSYENELTSRKIQWEERNEEILNQVDKGYDQITIYGIDSIETIMDFNPVCFRNYYQIDNTNILD